jgi:hypothetical protein
LESSSARTQSKGATRKCAAMTDVKQESGSPAPLPSKERVSEFCEACERGEHSACGMQTWCQCECDGEAIDYGHQLSEPDTNCITTPDGGCIGGPCMHDVKHESGSPISEECL